MALFNISWVNASYENDHSQVSKFFMNLLSRLRNICGNQLGQQIGRAWLPTLAVWFLVSFNENWLTAKCQIK